MPKHIFLSHAVEDQSIVSRLASALQSAGYKTWVSYRDIPPGSEWSREIERALHASLAVIIVCTRSSVESKYVRAEAEAAIGSDLLTIPLITQDVELPLRWNPLQWIRHSSNDIDAIIPTLLSKLPELPRAMLKTLLESNASLEDVRSLAVYGDLIYPREPLNSLSNMAHWCH